MEEVDGCAGRTVPQAQADDLGWLSFEQGPVEGVSVLGHQGIRVGNGKTPDAVVIRMFEAQIGDVTGAGKRSAVAAGSCLERLWSNRRIAGARR
jgi:hypothetical protein